MEGLTINTEGKLTELGNVAVEEIQRIKDLDKEGKYNTMYRITRD